MTIYLANIVTSSRILMAFALLFTKPFSPDFYLLYSFCGITDMIDGTIARKTHSESTFGSKLDSIADFTFIAVCLIKLFPVLTVPVWLWIWTGVIAVIKGISVITGFLCTHEFIFLHTIANKLTGFVLFLLPLLISFLSLSIAGFLICSIATFAAIQEGHYIRTGHYPKIH